MSRDSLEDHIEARVDGSVIDLGAALNGPEPIDTILVLGVTIPGVDGFVFV